MLGLLLLFLAGGALALLLAAIFVARDARRPRRRTAAYAVARGFPADPGEAGLRFREWTLDRPDGAALPVWDAVASGPHDELAVIFVHGWGQSKIDTLAWRHPYDEIAGRLVFFDLRGHGEATGPPSRLGAGEEADLLALIERVRPTRLLLVGHSMGCAIALAAARALAERHAEGDPSLLGLVLYGPYRDVRTPLFNRLRALGLPAHGVADLAILLLRPFGVRRLDAAADAAALDRPVLILHGERDVISPVEDARAIAEACRGEMHVLPDVAHSDHAHKKPDQHAALVRRFVSSCLDRAEGPDSGVTRNPAGAGGTPS